MITPHHFEVDQLRTVETRRAFHLVSGYGGGGEFPSYRHMQALPYRGSIRATPGYFMPNRGFGGGNFAFHETEVQTPLSYCT